MSESPTHDHPLKRTPLYANHVALGAKMVPFGGWEMPLHYGSQLEEHSATRATVGLFDTSHMGQVEIVGPDAERVVQELLTNDVAPLYNKQAIYSVMCREDGTLVDDVIATRFSPESFFVVVNAANYEKDVLHMERVASELTLHNTVVIPSSESWAMIAVQGPEWSEMFDAVLGEGPWEQLLPFHSFKGMQNGVEMIISTTGYTGEPGAEILVPPADVSDLWDAFVEAGARPCGLAARDTLRLEKGYRLAGQDFTDRDNPYEAGLGWVVKLDKRSFCGRNALRRIKEEGVARKLVGLLPEGKRIPRHDAPIFVAGEQVGAVTSGGFGPSIKRPIAMGHVAIEYAKIGAPVEIGIGSGTVPATICKTPFHPGAAE